MVAVAGVDGCRTGWVVVTNDASAFVRPDFAAVLDSLEPECVIGIDIPIGLHEEYVAGGRAADRAARKLLGKKWPSVFSAPARPAFGARDLAEAQARGCRMTLQAVAIMPKVEEVDALMTPSLQRRVFEVHPEVSFWAMNGEAPVLSKKDRRAGRDERRDLLVRVGSVVPARPRQGEKEDDLLDACAALWSARRISKGARSCVPNDPPLDDRGLRMEIRW